MNKESLVLRRRPVQVLNDTVIDQIAAGEVVERPASVVKELVENALDAGAQSISIVLENGGQSLIEVQDDGIGMSEVDAVTAVKRFGTSKIQLADELQSISTLGFRGEALPSIASVSRFRLITRPRSTIEIDSSDVKDDSDPRGTQIRIDGGTLIDVTRLATTIGSRVEVSNLFYNVPARRKFLKTAATETSVVRALINDIASANPGVRFRLVSDGKELLNLPPEASFFDRASRLVLVSSDALRIEEELTTPDGTYRLQAIVSKPRDAVAGAQRLRLLMNGRSVRDRILLRAIRDGFGDFLKGNRYPAGVASFTVPPQAVDINVHPQKAEVRFRSPDAIFRICHYALKRSLAASGLASQPTSDFARRSDFYKATTNQLSVEWSGPATYRPPSSESSKLREASLAYAYSGNAAARSEEFIQSDQISSAEKAPDVRELALQEPAQKQGLNNLRYQYRFVGQVFQCYLLFEGAEQVLLVDMHAAHERVTFARLNQQYRQGRLRSQILLIPESIPLTAQEEVVFTRIQPALAALGFDAELFGEQTVIVRAVPELLSRVSAQKLLEDAFAAIDSDGHRAKLDELIERVLARLACHGSIRSGQTLGRDEAFALLDQLTHAELAPFCPHGRPVMIELKKSTFESFFGRS